MSAYDGSSRVGLAILVIVISIIAAFMVTPLLAIPIFIVMLLFAFVQSTKHTIAFKICAVIYVLYFCYEAKKLIANANWFPNRQNVTLSHDISNSNINDNSDSIMNDNVKK